MNRLDASLYLLGGGLLVLLAGALWTPLLFVGFVMIVAGVVLALRP